MIQTKFSCSDEELAFLNRYKNYGFRDKSSMIREALNLFRKECELKQLRQSADLYAMIYDEDAELKELTEAAVKGWPE